MNINQNKFIPERDYSSDKSLFTMSREFLISRGYCCHSSCRNCPYKRPLKNGPRIISLVPSLTELFIAAGANIVGRTRCCVHPKELVKDIVKVGGTKDLNSALIAELNADYVIMDKEENTKEMAEKCPSPIISTHICSLNDLKNNLNMLSEKLGLTELLQYSDRIEKILAFSKFQRELKAVPGIIKWWKGPVAKTQKDLCIVYIIWCKPFICVTKDTFIGDVFSTLGFAEQLWAPEGRGLYPKFELSELPENALLLFSSEPYPFAKWQKEFLKQNITQAAALINGESYSWFGLRSLRFIEDQFFSEI
ncbi:MAG: hypothetical protein KBD78_09630 [Oligoflexales bacterium]|nr:hypothetical protein [Oligoflexales bacterium]